MVTRREFGAAILTAPLAGAVAAAQTRASVPRFASRFAGVRIGAQTYCYRSLRDTDQPWSAQRVDHLLDAVTTAMPRNRIDLAEFWIALLQPPASSCELGPTLAMDAFPRGCLR
jgi:hypothetical protein